ncbi:3533_t:CDS:2, partial [Funneliformis mosseae]
MAPKSGEFSLADDKDSLNNDNSANESEEIWSSILQGVASSKIVPTKSLLILGSLVYSKVLEERATEIPANPPSSDTLK